MTTWHKASDLPPPMVPEVEIVYWDGCYLCRIFGAYDHSEGEWYVGGEPLIDSDTPEWEVRYWAYPRLLPTAEPRQEEK